MDFELCTEINVTVGKIRLEIIKPHCGLVNLRYIVAFYRMSSVLFSLIFADV